MNQVYYTNILYFFFSLALIQFYKDIFQFLGMGDPSNEDTKITTLGITATIMILYNMIGWPYIYERTKEMKGVDTIKDEKDRAWAIVAQVDLVCDFATGIMVMVKNLASKEEI